MEDSHRRISESCQRVRRIYQNSLEGQRMNISEDFYCRWIIAHKLGITHQRRSLEHD